jgi:hypothetical protein
MCEHCAMDLTILLIFCFLVHSFNFNSNTADLIFDNHVALLIKSNITHTYNFILLSQPGSHPFLFRYLLANNTYIFFTPTFHLKCYALKAFSTNEMLFCQFSSLFYFIQSYRNAADKPFLTNANSILLNLDGASWYFPSNSYVTHNINDQDVLVNKQFNLIHG